MHTTKLFTGKARLYLHKLVHARSRYDYQGIPYRRYRFPIYGGDAYDDRHFELLGPEFGNKIYWDSHSFNSEEAVPGFNEYNAAYKKKHGKDVDAPWSMAGYDVVMVLAEAMRAVGTDGDAGQVYGRKHLRFADRKAGLVRGGKRSRAQQGCGCDGACQR